jgi:hypothetical protein
VKPALKIVPPATKLERAVAYLRQRNLYALDHAERAKVKQENAK